MCGYDQQPRVGQRRAGKQAGRGSLEVVVVAADARMVGRRTAAGRPAGRDVPWADQGSLQQGRASSEAAATGRRASRRRTAGRRRPPPPPAAGPVGSPGGCRRQGAVPFHWAAGGAMQEGCRAAQGRVPRAELVALRRSERAQRGEDTTDRAVNSFHFTGGGGGGSALRRAWTVCLPGWRPRAKPGDEGGNRAVLGATGGRTGQSCRASKQHAKLRRACHRVSGPRLLC